MRPEENPGLEIFSLPGYILTMLTKNDLTQITKIVGASEERLNKKLHKLDLKLDYAISFLDRDYIRLLQRVERIEEHLGLSSKS